MVKLDGVKRTFSWSRINAYARCPSYYEKLYIEKIVPIKKSPALSLGRNMAKGLDAYRTTGDKDKAIKAFTSSWEKEGKILAVTKDIDSKRSVERSLEILSNYIERYPDDPCNVIKPEISFKVPITDDILFIGRIDGVFRLADDSLAIIEDKTASRLGDSYFVRMKGSSQALWYMWAANELGLFEVEGKKHMPKCIINAIYIHHENNRFERSMTIKTSRLLNLAYENMKLWIQQILKAEELDLFPMNDVDNSVCTAYGGCEYLPLKYATGTMRERILRNEFKAKVFEG